MRRLDRDLTLIVMGTAVSVLGTAITSIVVLFALHERGALVVAGALLAELLPVVLGGPIVGRLVDRLPNRRLMIGAQLTQATAITVLAFSLETLPTAFVALFVVGSGTAIVSPAASALIPRAAGEDQATRAYALIGMARTTSMLLGATVGGPLVDGPGARAALLIDAATFLAHALAMTLVTVERRPDPGATRAGSGRAAGFRHLARVPALLAATAGLSVMILATVLVNVAEVFFVAEVLDSGATALGVLTACWGVGAILGARLAGGLNASRALLLGLATGGLAMAAGLIAPSAAPLLAVNLAAWVVAGIGNGLQNVTIQAITRLHTPEEFRGRAFAALGSVLMSANAVGTGCAGFVVGALGPRMVLLVAGIGTAVAASAVAATALRTPPMRELKAQRKGRGAVGPG